MVFTSLLPQPLTWSCDWNLSFEFRTPNRGNRTEVISVLKWIQTNKRANNQQAYFFGRGHSLGGLCHQRIKILTKVLTEHRCRLFSKSCSAPQKVAQFKINVSHEKVNSAKGLGITNYKPQNAMKTAALHPLACMNFNSPFTITV